MHAYQPLSVSRLPRLSRHVMGLMCAVFVLMLGACGFHLKGATPLPFDTLYTNIPENSSFGAHLRRVIVAASPNLTLVAKPQEAQAILTQLGQREYTREIAIGPDGLVEEYELILIFSFQLTDRQGNVLLPPTTLESRREMPYDSDALAAKQGEISTLFVDMRRSLADRIVRRLTSPQVIEAYDKAQAEQNNMQSDTDESLKLNSIPVITPEEEASPSPWLPMLPSLP